MTHVDPHMHGPLAVVHPIKDYLRTGMTTEPLGVAIVCRSHEKGFGNDVDMPDNGVGLLPMGARGSRGGDRSQSNNDSGRTQGSSDEIGAGENLS